jgi:hypothetical protein
MFEALRSVIEHVARFARVIGYPMNSSRLITQQVQGVFPKPQRRVPGVRYEFAGEFLNCKAVVAKRNVSSLEEARGKGGFSDPGNSQEREDARRRHYGGCVKRFTSPEVQYKR